MYKSTNEKSLYRRSFAFLFFHLFFAYYSIYEYEICTIVRIFTEYCRIRKTTFFSLFNIACLLIRFLFCGVRFFFLSPPSFSLFFVVVVYRESSFFTSLRIFLHGMGKLLPGNTYIQLENFPLKWFSLVRSQRHVSVYLHTSITNWMRFFSSSSYSFVLQSCRWFIGRQQALFGSRKIQFCMDNRRLSRLLPLTVVIRNGTNRKREGEREGGGGEEEREISSWMWMRMTNQF